MKKKKLKVRILDLKARIVELEAVLHNYRQDEDGTQASWKNHLAKYAEALERSELTILKLRNQLADHICALTR